MNEASCALENHAATSEQQKFMKTPTYLKITALVGLVCITSQAQTTAFTYQGGLNDGGNPATGNYDLSFAAYDAPANGNLLGAIVTNSPVNVSNGLFTTTVDFGSGVFSGGDVWLEMAVSTNAANAFSVIAPRQQVMSVPYAILAGTAKQAAPNSVNAGSIMPNAVGPGKISDGTVVRSLNGLADVLTLSAGTNVTITPSGNNLTISSVGSGGSGIWSVLNNNTYYNAGNVGVGTDSPLERLTLAGVTSFNTGLKVTGSSPNGTGIALENTAVGGHKYDFISGGVNDGIGAGAFGLYDETAAGYRFAIATNGNVGIGTGDPQATLDIVSAQHALTMTAYGPDVTFKDTANNNARSVIQSVGGDLNFFTESYMSGANPFSFLKVADNGNVGIGSATPNGKLEVVAQDALRLVGYNPFLTLFDSNAGYARGRIQGVAGDINLFTESYLNGANPFSFLKVANNGNVGIGSAAPVGKLEVVAQDALRLVGYQPFLTLLDDNAGYAKSRLQGVGGDVLLETEAFINSADPTKGFLLVKSGTGNVGIGTATPQNTLDVNGTTRTHSIIITGGADVAEPFKMGAADLPKGAVVVIDREHPGELKLSSREYDPAVAGIISGANGINPGIALHQEGALDGGQNVALSGRVYVLADAANGAIEPGDLLTTSATPGHAMKVANHLKGQGAILGKAMTGLNSGKGMVLVLVTLQ